MFFPIPILLPDPLELMDLCMLIYHSKFAAVGIFFVLVARDGVGYRVASPLVSTVAACYAFTLAISRLSAPLRLLATLVFDNAYPGSGRTRPTTAASFGSGAAFIACYAIISFTDRIFSGGVLETRTSTGFA